jgi:DNA-binding transcriptional regulator YdaS (Cro superfamily)
LCSDKLFCILGKTNEGLIMSDKNDVLSESVKSFGGQRKFGSVMGASQQLVSYWISKGNLPANKVLQAEAVFSEAGINADRHDLRPDVFGVRNDLVKSA